MDFTGLDIEETRTDFTLELEKSLKASPLLSKVFILLLNNPICNATEMADILRKTHGQVHTLCKRLVAFNVVKKVEGKSRFYINKSAFPDTTWQALRDDALETIKEKQE